MDILERLKIIAETTSEQWPTASIDYEYREAVKEIERLRAENAELKKDAKWKRVFLHKMSLRGNPGRGAWKIVEQDPMYGEEKEVDDWEDQINTLARG